MDNLFYNGHYKTKLSYTDYCCVTEDFATENIDEEALRACENFGFPRQFLVKCLNRGDINHATACYFLLTNSAWSIFNNSLRSLKCFRQDICHAVHGSTQFVIQNLIQTCQFFLPPVYFYICFLLRRGWIAHLASLFYLSDLLLLKSMDLFLTHLFRGFFVLEFRTNDRFIRASTLRNTFLLLAVRRWFDCDNLMQILACRSRVLLLLFLIPYLAIKSIDQTFRQRVRFFIFPRFRQSTVRL